VLQIGEDYVDRTVELPVGQVMELRLGENPTTGFRWQLKSDGGPACALEGDTFQPKAAAPGGGGEHSWQFRGVRAGDCEIELLYRRRWENAPASRSFKVHVQVKG
jgi:inhibitor of cysteine peptidase